MKSRVMSSCSVGIRWDGGVARMLDHKESRSASTFCRHAFRALLSTTSTPREAVRKWADGRRLSSRWTSLRSSSSASGGGSSGLLSSKLNGSEEEVLGRVSMSVYVSVRVGRVAVEAARHRRQVCGNLPQRHLPTAATPLLRLQDRPPLLVGAGADHAA